MTYAIESNVKPPKTRKARKCPANVTAAYDAYADAYKKVYGVKPTGFTYNKATNYIYVGNSAGITLLRLKELTRQLIWRAGE
jgi:hypothetical protein